ncbi:nitrate- and nitrite sensing domain-containing protein [Streptomyces sp. NPDC048331]|uniref:sensor histidine kinase n=1 Tax=Streptomyces sp. NPDC048331 TaxID=3365534 RepID=UPI00371345D6
MSIRWPFLRRSGQRRHAVPQPPAERRASGISPVNWGFTWRLAAITVLPLLAFSVLGTIRTLDSAGAADRAAQAARTAHLSGQAAALTAALQDEAGAAALTTDNAAAKAAQNGPPPPWTGSVAATDGAMADFLEAAAATGHSPPALRRRLEEFTKRAPTLSAARRNASSAPQGAPKSSPGGSGQTAKTADAARSTLDVQTQYEDLIAPLLGLHNEIALNPGASTKGKALYCVSVAKSAMSTQRSLITMVLAGRLDATQAAERVQVAAGLERAALAEFAAGADPADAQFLSATVSAAGMERLAQLRTTVLAGAPSGAGLATTPQAFYGFADAQMQQLQKVEDELGQDLVAATTAALADARGTAIRSGWLTLLVVLLSVGLVGWISRTTLREIRTLRNSALSVAHQQLPRAIESLVEAPDRTVDPLAATPVHGSGDLAQVAQAFDAVARQAVRLASEQALLRSHVSDLFASLAKRTHSLTMRQLEVIGELERDETSPERLERLFRLDHLATRMRRNGENLLVLTGEGIDSGWGEPVPLQNVLRAALGEVEQYQRVRILGAPDLRIAGNAAKDIIHLLAELLDNATSFSSPQSAVLVTATELPQGSTLIEVSDLGFGLTSKELDHHNTRLAAPPPLDGSVARRMGLYVVARLAEHHAIHVELRAVRQGVGTTAMVTLPPTLCSTGEPELEPRLLRHSR